jgi:integrase
MLADPEVATVKDAFVRTRDKALFILVLKTALRISELLSLKLGGFSWFKDMAQISQGSSPGPQKNDP